MKSHKQILRDKSQMDIEQRECVQRYTIPQAWVVAPELNVFFDQLNHRLFRGLLPKVPCYWSPPVRSFLGRCHARPHPKTKNIHSVALEFPSNSPDRALYDTMIHEMVHVYQSVMGIPMGHNRLFHSINKSKRITYLHQQKESLDPLLYPPRNTKKNRMWSRAHDIEDQLCELSELLFESPIPIPTCWWHSTKTRTPYTLESYWCHTEQIAKPNTLELSKKSFAPSERDLIYIVCTIASWKAQGIYKQRAYRKELYTQKKRAYFGEPKKIQSRLSKSIKMDTERLLTFLHHQKTGQNYTPKNIFGTTSAGKTHMIRTFLEHLKKENI